MQKKYILAVAVALVAAVAAPQMASAEASFGADVASAYVFRGATINDDLNIQPYLEGSFGALTAGAWGNYQAGDVDEINEVDLYASVDLPLGDSSPVDVSLGYCIYTYPNSAASATAADGTTTVTGAAEDDQEINIGISADAPLSPSLGVNIGVDGAIDEMVYLELGLGHEMEYESGLSSSAGLAVGYVADEGKAGGETGFSHATLSAGLAHGPLGLSVSYIIETDDKVLVVDEDVVGMLSLDIPGAIALLK